MFCIPNKYDAILERELTNKERVKCLNADIGFMRNYLDMLERTLSNVSENLNEEQIMEFAEGVKIAENALMNAAFMGCTGFSPRVVRTVFGKSFRY